MLKDSTTSTVLGKLIWIKEKKEGLEKMQNSHLHIETYLVCVGSLSGKENQKVKCWRWCQFQQSEDLERIQWVVLLKMTSRHCLSENKTVVILRQTQKQYLKITDTHFKRGKFPNSCEPQIIKSISYVSNSKMTYFTFIFVIYVSLLEAYNSWKETYYEHIVMWSSCHQPCPLFNVLTCSGIVS